MGRKCMHSLKRGHGRFPKETPKYFFYCDGSCYRSKRSFCGFAEGIQGFLSQSDRIPFQKATVFSPLKRRFEHIEAGFEEGFKLVGSELSAAEERESIEMLCGGLVGLRGELLDQGVT